jgi:hypothetical protein
VSTVDLLPHLYLYAYFIELIWSPIMRLRVSVRGVVYWELCRNMLLCERLMVIVATSIFAFRC